MSMRTPQAAVPKAPARRTTSATSALRTTFLREAVDVRARAADPPALDDGGSMAGSSHVPRQELAARSAAQHLDLDPFRLRHDPLPTGVPRMRTTRRDEALCDEVRRERVRQRARDAVGDLDEPKKSDDVPGLRVTLPPRKTRPRRPRMLRLPCDATMRRRRRATGRPCRNHCRTRRCGGEAGAAQEASRLTRPSRVRRRRSSS